MNLKSEEDLNLKKSFQKKKSFEKFLKDFKEMTTNEEKLKFSIDFMKKTLSQEKEPDFRGFWESKRLCLPLFKENLNSVVRSKHWKEYIELSLEAKKLKVILDEQSDFALEQLEIAIKSLEGDIKNYDELLNKIPPVKFLKKLKSIDFKESEYSEIQRELNLLNSFTARINSLRKGIVKTDMRIRFKSRFFKILSSIGDRVFPKRKELIKKISEKFVLEVNGFIEKYFSSESSKKIPFYVLREEIKILQNIAKILTLNTKAFSETRLNLSKCWDKIKILEGGNKRDFSEKIKIFKENFKKVFDRIKKIEREKISIKELAGEREEILSFMRGVELGNLDVKKLKKELAKVFEYVNGRESKKLEEERRKELLKKQKDIESVKTKIKKLTEEENKYSIEDFVLEKEKIVKKIEKLPLNKIEKQGLERLLKSLKDVITNKKEKALLELSDGELQALEKMKKILSDRLKRKLEIKDQIEEYRKALGKSGFDFEQAMMHRKMIDLEKERLSKINDSIKEIEDKIKEIEN
jgi:hypothetical protein